MALKHIFRLVCVDSICFQWLMATMPLKIKIRLVVGYSQIFPIVSSIMRLKLLWGLVTAGFSKYRPISGFLRMRNSAFLNDQKNQISEYDYMFCTIFIDYEFMGQNESLSIIYNGWLIR